MVEFWFLSITFLVLSVVFEKIGSAIKDERISDRLFDQLRSMIQHSDRLGFLFSGVQTLEEHPAGVTISSASSRWKCTTSNPAKPKISSWLLLDREADDIDFSHTLAQILFAEPKEYPQYPK
jgi:hypothetical protein